MDACLPIVGDPLCLVGLLHVIWLRFLFLISLGKFDRYLLIAVAINEFIPVESL